MHSQFLAWNLATQSSPTALGFEIRRWRLDAGIHTAANIRHDANAETAATVLEVKLAFNWTGRD